MGSKEIALSSPIKVDGEEVRTLTLKSPTVADLRVMDEGKGQIDQARRLIAALANVPPSSIDQMSGEDFLKCSHELVGFLGVSQPTGET